MMVVHMLRFYCDPDANSFLIDSYIPQWLVNHTAWEVEENEPPKLSEMPETGEPGYYVAEWWFDWDGNSKEVLLSNISQYTAAYSDWHRIGYHVCDHDEEVRGGCVWEDVREQGDVPDYVPNL